ncbi:alpha-glucosidase [Zoogloea sp.]|uniref:alpha-glucosidase n=1 Tax=uncultured Zoogloea sp. TaxID=160237 RepID=UPI002629DB70|nr:alpha-glucosidase [uncultured Zoogloea sp.]
MDSNADGIGDLPGILARLDYLQWLGIDVIWICPIYRSPNDDNGYDVSDYQAIMAEFGTMADFDRLLAEVHRRGMRLILDLVLNHTSDEHAWFVESRASLGSPKRDWYIWRDGQAGSPPNNWESIFGGPAWELDEASGQYFLHLFSRRQPDLNWECAPMREALYGMVRWWLDKGIDGFRLDAVSHIRKAPGLPDMPNPEGLAQVPCFPLHMNVDGVLGHLDELCQRTFRHYDVMTVGEANGVGPAEAVEWVGESRQRLDMIFQFEHLALWSANPRAGLDVAGLKRVFGAWQKALAGRGWNALFIENHDIPRVVSLWGDVEHHWRDSATALATVYFLLQGTPFIYQGQEIGMTNTVFGGIADFDDVLARNRWQERTAAGEDEAAVLADLALTARDNARTPMQWSAAPGAGFTTGRPWLAPNPNHVRINVAAQQADPDSVLNYYRRLIALRKAERGLVEGAYHPLMASHRQIYAYCRGEGAGRLVVIVNLGPRPARYCHAGLLLAHDGLLLANLPVAPHAPRDTLSLRPYEARVYRVGAP